MLSMWRLWRIDGLLPIGMKFVKVKEATSTDALAGRWYGNNIAKLT